MSATFPSGTYMGHCVLGKYLIVFIHGSSGGKDYICKVYKEGGAYLVKNIFEGNLGFNPSYPVQTLGVYENDLIQKVYWTDGVNQPRYINVADDTIRTNSSDVDFVAELTLGDTVSVTDSSSGGQFAPGVI